MVGTPVLRKSDSDSKKLTFAVAQTLAKSDAIGVRAD